jgi:hypothetical protein
MPRRKPPRQWPTPALVTQTLIDCHGVKRHAAASLGVSSSYVMKYADLGAVIAAHRATPFPSSQPLTMLMHRVGVPRVTDAQVRDALAACHGNQTHAAATLGVPRSSIVNMLARMRADDAAQAPPNSSRIRGECADCQCYTRSDDYTTDPFCGVTIRRVGTCRRARTAVDTFLEDLDEEAA